MAKAVVAATGAWGNQFSDVPIVSPTKGVHIVLPNMNLPAALLLMMPSDQRVFFAMPWKGHTLVGCTEESRAVSEANQISSTEVQYLLDGMNAYHSHREWRISDVISAFSGFRPLIKTKDHHVSKQSREEQFIWTRPNMLAVVGGKYTTYRHIAEQCVNELSYQIFNQKPLMPAHSDSLQKRKAP